MKISAYVIDQKHMRTIERHLQQCLNRIEIWALYNDFKLYKIKKTVCQFLLT